MSYDTKCYDLAESFLSDEPEKNTEANRSILAQRIQDAIEMYMSYEAEPKLHTHDRDGVKIEPSGITSKEAAERGVGV